MKWKRIREQIIDMAIFIVVTGISMLIMIAVYTDACGHPVNVLKMLGL